MDNEVKGKRGTHVVAFQDTVTLSFGKHNDYLRLQPVTSPILPWWGVNKVLHIGLKKVSIILL